MYILYDMEYTFVRFHLCHFHDTVCGAGFGMQGSRLTQKSLPDWQPADVLHGFLIASYSPDQVTQHRDSTSPDGRSMSTLTGAFESFSENFHDERSAR